MGGQQGRSKQRLQAPSFLAQHHGVLRAASVKRTLLARYLVNQECEQLQPNEACESEQASSYVS